MLDQREEVIIVGLLKAAADGEGEIDMIRSKICEDPDFEPYTAFKALQMRPMTSGLLTAKDIAVWLSKQYYKTTLLREQDIQNVLEHYGESGMLRYESFLKLILPREDKQVRSLVMCRRTTGGGGYLGDKDLGKDGGYHFVRLLEQESAMYEELTLRKKRLVEYEWRENKERIIQRAFAWLQSQSAVPGVCHVSVLGVCRLLSDLKEILTVLQVERMFHRVNVSGTDMLSFGEFQKFCESKEADAYLNELYIKYYSTQCPGCGAMCQRDGGACNSVTCPFCRTSFKCDTRVEDSDYGNLGSSMRANFGSGYGGSMMNTSGYSSPSMMARDMRCGSPSFTMMDRETARASAARDAAPGGSLSRFSSPSFSRSASPSFTFKKDTYDSPRQRSMISTTASGLSPRSPSATQLHDLSYSSIRSMSPNIAGGYSPRASSPFSRGVEEDPFRNTSYGRRQVDNSLSTYKRQKASLGVVMDTMLHMLKLDSALEMEKEHLWQAGVNLEAAFDFLDRYSKGYIADTDVWQIMHSDVPVSFSGISQLFRDIKAPQAKKQGQLNLAELAIFLFPKQAEEVQHVYPEMKDAETKNVLYVVRSTVSCPGCGCRVQRTFEGCSSVTCPVCVTPFRCNLIGDDRDQEFRVTLTQKSKIRHYIKFATDLAEDQEQLRKNLLCEVDSISSVLLDAFLMIAEDKGYISFLDFKKALLSEQSLRLSEIELLWWRFAGDRKRLGFVEFAQQLRPFGTS